MAKKSKAVVEEPVVAVVEKDDEELELEKVVFGDMEGFESGLKALDLDSFDISDSEASFSEDDSRDEGDNSGEEDVATAQDDNLFFVDDGEDDAKMDVDDSESDEESESESDDDDLLDVYGGSAAWVDSDDERLQVSLNSSDRLRKLRTSLDENTLNGKEYNKRLRSRFQKIYPVPQWAKPEESKDGDSSSEDGDSDSEVRTSDPLSKLLKTQSTYISSTATKLLPPSVLDITRLRDANAAAMSQSAVQTLDFHPTHPLLLSGGYDRTLRMYHIEGKTNPVATSLHVKTSPFQMAQFHVDGRRVFAGGRRRNMYIWDIESGNIDTITRMYGHEQTQRSMEKFELSPSGEYVALVGGSGWMNVLSAASGQWVTGAKIDGVIADIAWHSDNNMTIVSKGGDIWEWDSTARKFSGRWKDEGGAGATTIALGGKNDRWCAIGSQSGIVNVYDRLNPSIAIQLSESEAPIYKPKAVLQQLVTPISSLKFSGDGQMLAMGSRAKRDAFRLAHVPSFTVYKNWPTSGTPLGRVTAVAFTPGSQMLTVGNEGGRARLWKLNHYSQNT